MACTSSFAVEVISVPSASPTSVLAVDASSPSSPAHVAFVPLRPSPKPRDYRGEAVSPRDVTLEPTTFAVKLKHVGGASSPSLTNRGLSLLSGKSPGRSPPTVPRRISRPPDRSPPSHQRNNSGLSAKRVEVGEPRSPVGGVRDEHEDAEHLATRLFDVEAREMRVAVRENQLSQGEEKFSIKVEELAERERALEQKEAALLTRALGQPPSFDLSEREQKLTLQENQLTGQARRFKVEEEQVMAQQQEWARILESLTTKEAELSAQAQSLANRERELAKQTESLKIREEEVEEWKPQIYMMTQRENRVLLRETQIEKENEALARLSTALKAQKADITALYTSYSKMEKLCGRCLLEQISPDVVLLGPAVRDLEAKLHAAVETKDQELAADLREQLSYIQCECQAHFLPDALFCATCGAKRSDRRADFQHPRHLEDISTAIEGVHFAGLSNCLKEGYLVKKGGKVRTWKKRYFVLQSNGKFMYFEHSDGKKLCGQTLVSRQSSVGYKDSPTGFWLCPQPNGRIFELESDDIECRKEWVDAIESLLGPNEPRQWDRTVVPYAVDGKIVVEKL